MKVKLKRFYFSAVVDGKKVEFGGISTLREGKYRKDGYVVELRFDDDGHPWLKFYREDGEEMDIERVIYTFSLPLLNFGKVIVPDSGRFYMNHFLPRQVWSRKFTLTGRAFGNPFLALLDLHERPLFALGLLGDLKDTEFHFFSPGANRKNSLTVQGGRLKFRITKPIGKGITLGKMKVFEDGFYVGGGAKTWWHELRNYGRKYQAIRNLKFYKTERAFYPAMCTWRVVNSDHITHEWVVKAAKAAADLGLKAFIFDDGWYGHGLDSVSMVIDVGDWPISVPGKFDDIRETIKELKKIGINPILWYCPICVGPHSKNLERYRPYLAHVNGELYKCPAGFHTLCVRNPEARRIMVENLLRLIDYGAGGVKIDLFDYMPEEPCDADHEHDVPTTSDGIRLIYRELFEAARKKDPNFMYSIKNNYGNVELSVYASVVRGGDSPFDPNIMMLRSMYPSAYVPVVHNDYGIWTEYESPQHLALILIRQVSMGVPNFTINPLKMPEKQKEIMRAWLNLFNSLLPLYRDGDFEPLDPSLQVWKRDDGKTAMITVLHPAREIPFIPYRDRILILNATSHEEIFVAETESDDAMEYKAFDFSHKPIDRGYREIRGRIRVPVGGFVELRRIGS